MRFVVGVELAIPVVDRLSLLQEEAGEAIEALGARVRWTPVEQIRLNLRVFDTLDPSAVDRVQATLGEFAKALRPFSFETRGTRADRAPGEAKLLYAQVEDPSDTLRSLAEHINRAADPIGFAHDERPWHPRVLVGRIATPGPAVDLDDTFAPYAQTAWGETECRELILYRTQLVGREARTRVAKRFALGTGR